MMSRVIAADICRGKPRLITPEKIHGNWHNDRHTSADFLISRVRDEFFPAAPTRGDRGAFTFRRSVPNEGSSVFWEGSRTRGASERAIKRMSRSKRFQRSTVLPSSAVLCPSPARVFCDRQDSFFCEIPGPRECPGCRNSFARIPGREGDAKKEDSACPRGRQDGGRGPSRKERNRWPNTPAANFIFAIGVLPSTSPLRRFSSLLSPGLVVFEFGTMPGRIPRRSSGKMQGGSEKRDRACRDACRLEMGPILGGGRGGGVMSLSL